MRSPAPFHAPSPASPSSRALEFLARSDWLLLLRRRRVVWEGGREEGAALRLLPPSPLPVRLASPGPACLASLRRASLRRWRPARAPHARRAPQPQPAARASRARGELLLPAAAAASASLPSAAAEAAERRARSLKSAFFETGIATAASTPDSGFPSPAPRRRGSRVPAPHSRLRALPPAPFFGKKPHPVAARCA